MIKKLLIVCLFLLFLPIVSAADSLTADDATATWVRGVDTSVDTTFTVDNTGDTILNVSFDIGDLFLGDGTQLNETIADPSSILNLINGTSQDVTITLTGIPSDQAVGTYTGNVTTTYGALNNETISTLTISVEDPVYSINTADIAFPLSQDPNATISTTFLIENTGNTALTNINFSSNVAAGYELTFDPASISTLGAGGSTEIDVSVFVPYEEEIGNHSIGTVSVLSDQQNFTSAYIVYLDIEPKLNIDDLDIYVDDDVESNVEDGETIGEKAEPGSEIELVFRLKNTFSEASEIDIEEITITATLIDPEDEEVDEIEIDVTDLDADEKSDEESILFELPLDIEDGEFTIEIRVEGVDENDVDHRLDWTVYFDLEKKSHDVIIYKAYLTPEKVKCTRTSTLYVRLMNIGSKTEDEARLTIENDELGIAIDERDLELSKNPDDDDNTYTREVAVNAKDIAAGTYSILTKAYYEEDLLDDIKTVNLVVEDCPKETEEPEEPEETEEPEEPEEPEEVELPTTGEEIPTTTETPFTKSTAGVVLLLLANAVVLVVVIFFVAKLLVIPRIPKP